MNWLTLAADWLANKDNRIPVGQWSKLVFDWMKTNLNHLFDWIAAILDGLIAGILWILQGPPALLVIAAFVALTWLLQRNWKTCLGVGLGFLFIVNQGYWKETTESLTLILASCVVCIRCCPRGLLR